MKKILLWVIAVFVTLFLLVYQRMTGPTYDLRGKIETGGEKLGYSLPRAHVTTEDCEVRIPNTSAEASGTLVFRRFKTGDPFTRQEMKIENGELVGHLPKQPAAGKLEYRIFINRDGQETSLTGDIPVVIRFRGPVPAPVLIAHILVIFLAFLFSTRAFLEALQRDGDPRRLALLTAISLFLGGMILGPIMQKFAFGAFWTGFPFGHDLTDNKTLIALIGWIVALIAMRRSKKTRIWVLGAYILMLIIFIIPHSMLGSELDYSEMDVPAPTETRDTIPI